MKVIKRKHFFQPFRVYCEVVFRLIKMDCRK